MKLAAHIALALALALILASCADEAVVIRESIIIINLDDDDWDDDWVGMDDDWYFEPECIDVLGSTVCPDIPASAASDPGGTEEGGDTGEDDSGDEDKTTE